MKGRNDEGGGGGIRVDPLSAALRTLAALTHAVVFLPWSHPLCVQRIKDWAVKMRNPEVPYSTIEECARHADIIGVSGGSERGS